MLLLPDFNGAAAQAFIDPFRAANYLRGEQLFAWEFLSLAGNTVTASSGLSIARTRTCLEAHGDYDLVVFFQVWTSCRR